MADPMSSRKASPAPAKKSSAFGTILFAGLVAGVLDIGFVFVYYRTADPQAILRSIAAALFGPEANKGGVGMAAVGLGMHFAVALVCAAVFYALSRKLKFLTGRAVLFGMLYGAGVWLVMQLLVLPLTKTPPRSFPPPRWEPVFIAHLICVGPPIALLVKRGDKQ